MISGKNNEFIKEISKLVSSSKARREKGLFAAEGIRLCRDALDSRAHITAFLYTSEAAMKYSADFDSLNSAADKSYELAGTIFNK